MKPRMNANSFSSRPWRYQSLLQRHARKALTERVRIFQLPAIACKSLPQLPFRFGLSTHRTKAERFLLTIRSALVRYAHALRWTRFSPAFDRLVPPCV